MINAGLQAGFGASIDADIEGILEHGYTIIRQDLLAEGADIYPLIEEFANYAVTPIFLIGGGNITLGGKRIEPHRLAAFTDAIIIMANSVGLTEYIIEIGNEPDISSYSEEPEDFAEAVRECHFAARTAGFEGMIVSGGIANLNNRGFDYLKKMIKSRALPEEDLIIGFHRYPESNRGPLAPHDRFSSRDDEWNHFMTIVRDYPVVCTEFGYHTADVLDDMEVAKSVIFDLEFYQERDVAFAVQYQLNDGPTNEWIDRYGIRDYEGNWKPVADAVKLFVEGE